MGRLIGIFVGPNLIFYMDRPTVALMYDFDGTLSPSNMQEYDFMDAIGLTDKKSFWNDSQDLARHNSSTILSYMKLMVERAAERYQHTSSAVCGIRPRNSFFSRSGGVVRPDQS